MEWVTMPVCELCSGKKFSVIAEEIREGPGKILKCNDCGLICLGAEYTGDELKEYYNVEYQLTNSLRLGAVQTPKEHFDDSYSHAEEVFKRIRPFLKETYKVLEIGCGTGELLYQIRPHVKEVVGVELNEEFVEFIQSDLGITAFAQDVNTIQSGDGFDMILCIMTLDHLPNPKQTLFSMRRLLKEEGVLYIEVPNTDEALNRFLPDWSKKQYNKFFWHKAHFFYFTRETLGMILDTAGFSSDISCRHQYTLVNFLRWYFCGTPQRSFIEATSGNNLFQGESEFEVRMNELIFNSNDLFQTILSETSTGDTLCCVARHKKGSI